MDIKDTESSAPSVETRLKISALGLDTAGALDAVSSVLCAAIKSDGRDSGLKTTANGLSIQEAMPGMKEGKDNDTGGEGRVIPSEPHKDATTASCDAKTDDPPLVGLSIDSSKPALWSIRFTFSHLETVLSALETAVSGLTFVVVAGSEGAEPETSTLW